MDVLVMESDPGAAQSAVEDLEAAGHRVHRCHEPGGPAFPCAGLVADACPLEHEAIDVVLTVRRHVLPRPSTTEDGVACALRRRIPVVVTGRTLLNPFENFGAIPAEGDAVKACEAVAAGPQAGHTEVAGRVLADLFELHGVPTRSGDVVVHRTDGRLKATLRVSPSVPDSICKVAAVRITGALRTYDPYVVGIDVGCEVSDSGGRRGP